MPVLASNRLGAVVQHENNKQVFIQIAHKAHFFNCGKELRELFMAVAQSHAQIAVVTHNGEYCIFDLHQWIEAVDTYATSVQFIYTGHHGSRELRRLMGPAYADYRERHPLHVFA